MKEFKSYIAEFIGTFTLTLAVLVGVSVQTPLAVPVLAALTVLLYVYTIGGLSGAHLNPAVTVGLFSIGKITPKTTAMYILVQLCAASGAMLFVPIFGIEIASIAAQDSLAVFTAECLGAMILVFGITAVVYKQVEATVSGLVIGGSLLLGATLAVSVSNAVLNPAVAIGIQSVSFAYIVAPLLGGILGAWLARYLFTK